MEVTTTTAECIAIVGIIVNVGVLVVYAFTLFAIKRQATIAEKTANQALNASFLYLFPIVERHHSPTIAEYRRFAREELPGKCAAARRAGLSLRDLDLPSSRMASDIANYYESIGMLVQHGEKNLLPDVVNMLLDMVHVSAHDVWEIFHDNIDVIHPDKLGSWAGSFEHLYFRIAEYKPDLPATKPRLVRNR